MRTINLTWLAALHDRAKQPREPKRPPHMPHWRPTAEVAQHVRALAAERLKIAADDPRLQVDAQLEVVQHIIASEEKLHARELGRCYAAIAVLGLLLALAIVALALCGVLP
jgi:hypothetical protein